MQDYFEVLVQYSKVILNWLLFIILNALFFLIALVIIYVQLIIFSPPLECSTKDMALSYLFFNVCLFGTSSHSYHFLCDQWIVIASTNDLC